MLKTLGRSVEWAIRTCPNNTCKDLHVENICFCILQTMINCLRRWLEYKHATPLFTMEIMPILLTVPCLNYCIKRSIHQYCTELG